MDCLPYQTLNLEEWGQILTAPLEGKRYPLSASFELTNRCNMTCQHCFINQPAHDNTAMQRELSTSEVIGIIDQMVDAGCLFLTLTGGEPLLRPDFSEIFCHARQRGMLVALFTNGTMLNEDLADMLQDFYPFMVEISLYGATQEVYETVTRVPGSYRRCRKGIDLVLERGIPLTLKTSLTTRNLQELPAMRRLADQLGVNFRYDGLLWPRLDGRNGFPVPDQLPIDELLDFDDADPERRQAIIKEVERLKGLTTRDERVYSCGAGHTNFHVDCEGRMSICLMAREPSFNLRQIPFLQAWDRIGGLRQQKRQQPSKCLSCIMNTFCTQCPGWSQAVHGDDETVVDFICKLGQLRTQKALMIKEEEVTLKENFV